MRRKNIVLVVLLVIAVTTVFCVPFANLEPSALRALHAAQALRQALLSAAYVVALFFCIAFYWSVPARCEFSFATIHDLVADNCARLC